MTGDHSFPGTPLTSSREMRMRGCDCTAFGHGLGKHVAIDRERGARGHPRHVGRPHHDRSEPPHLFLDKTDGVVDLVGAKRIAADELSQAIGLVHGRRAHGPHLVDGDIHAQLRGLPRGFAPGQPAADDVISYESNSLVFHQPRLKITPPTTASVEKATVIAMNTPCGPIPK